ncbi:hypothetical protein H0H93_000664 [Arthromyces matolae]|nr:hypothetical protein H0H93_000664 [Arthromyces matolae]
MSTQVLGSIGSSPPTAGPSYLKRSPPAIYDEPESKRMKEDVFNISFSGEREEKEIDPKKLCPYCDSPLPTQPTSKLKRMLALAKKKSKPEPRLGNSLGRTAPFTIYIALCQRHQFESQMLPEAERKGWPQEIDWSNLGKRVRKMKSLLRAIIEDRGDAQLDDFLGEETGSRPRARCVFWREALEEVKKKGARAAAGVHAQFATFDKTQPGYYGEMGYAIIHQTLYDLFPPSSIDPDLVSPLTATEFLQRIMVPEIGTRLIMQDMDFDEGQMEEAIKILRDSATYGVAMFPVDEEEAKGDSDDADLGAADMIVMERARKRRKELDETGPAEEKEYQKQTKKAEKGKKQAGGKKKREESEEEVDVPAQRPKPRPRGKNLDNASVRNLEIASAVADADRQGETAVQVPPRPKPRPLGKNTSSVSMRDVEMPSFLRSLGVDHTPKPDQAQKKVQDSLNSDHFGSPEAERTPMPRSKSRLRPSRSNACSNKYPDTDEAPSRPMPANLSDVDIDPCATEASTDADWDTGRMPKPQKKSRGKNKSYHVELSDDDVPQAVPPSSSSSSRTTFPIGSHDRNLDDSGHDTPKSHEKSKTLDTIPPLQRARERKQRSMSHAKPKKNEHSWLLSDHSHSSMESIQS